MPLIIGQTAGGILIPIRVDDNGVVSVSAAVSSLPSLPAGDNNIGNVDVVTLPTLPAGDNNIGNVDVVTLPALPAGTNLIGHIQAENFGLYEGSKYRDPIRLGYSQDKSQQVLDENADAGTPDLTGDTVPEGEIWVVEGVHARNIYAAPTKILLAVVVNTQALVLNDQSTIAAGEFVTWSGAITLSKDDYVKAWFYGTTGGDDIELIFHARRIDIDQ